MSLLALLSIACGRPTRVVHASYDDGSPKSFRSEIQNEAGEWVADGTFEAVHPNGQRRASGTYVGGSQDGAWREWYPNGQLGVKGEWANGARTGEWTIWDEHGNQLARGRYAGGEKHGEWSTWHPNGALKEQGFFVDGKTEGVFVQRSADGTVDAVLSGVYENGEKVADWHFDGELAIDYPDETPRERSRWKDGLRDGPSVLWYHGGTKLSEGRFEHGRRSGPWRFWSPSGELDTERSGVYVNDRRTASLTAEQNR